MKNYNNFIEKMQVIYKSENKIKEKLNQEKISFSKMTGKMTGIGALNTNTLTNEFCQKMNNCKNAKIICTQCYSWKMLKTFRKNAVPCFEKNSRVLSSELIPLEKIPVINFSFFRFNAHGEIINELHLKNIIRITLKNPHCNFTLYTKRKKFIFDFFNNNEKPKNLILVYSNPIINSESIMPQFFDKVFNVYTFEGHKGVKINCGQKSCLSCLKCYKHNKIDTVNELLKNANGGKVKKS